MVLTEEHRAVHIDARLIGKIYLETRDYPKVIRRTVYTFQHAMRTRSTGRYRMEVQINFQVPVFGQIPELILINFCKRK